MKRRLQWALRIMAAAACTSSASAQTIAIGTSPTTRIGQGGDERALFVRVLDAWQFPNAEIVVADLGSPSPVRAYKSTGAFSRVIAATGSGPGEVGPSLYAAFRTGDSVMTYEIAGARLSAFDVLRGTKTTKSMVLHGASRRPVFQGALGGGGWLAVGAPGPLRPHADGAFRDAAYFGIVGANSDSLHVVGQAARAAFYANNRVAGPANLQRVRYDSLVPWSTIYARDSRIVVADPAAPAILVFDASGKQVLRIVSPFPATGYDRAQVAHGRTAVLAATRTPYDSGMRTGMYELAGRPRVAPHFKRVIPGPDGEMWVEKFWLDESVPREFAVVDRQGRLVAKVQGPPGVRFTEFGRDYAIGVATDRDGVQTVVRYALARAGAPR